MCGITGFLSARDRSADELDQIASRMSDAISHRGPDDRGIWVDTHARVALGHRRLSIVDLSEHGHQPMTSHCGRYVMVFNGEIYNHQALRHALAPRPWRGHSDTETVLALMTDLGPVAALDRLVGMFAIAVWDREQRALTLARDRMGEKPLYYGRLPSGDLIFGSELHALRAHPNFAMDIDRDALALFMRHGAVSGQHSIYAGISKLAPGAWMRVDAHGAISEGRYWDLTERARALARDRQPLSDVDAVNRLEAILSEAVRDQMVADVPLGAFLSGGVDSSTIVALMAKQSGQDVRTFSIGFSEAGYNEAEHAKAVAKHLGTRHTELYVSGDDALAVVPRLARMYDEPFADASQIPTFLVAQMARRHVTVALSGDAGDELFAGYNRYLLAERAWGKVSRMPLLLRRPLSRALLSMSPAALDGIAGPAQRLLGTSHANVGDKLHKFSRTVLTARSANDMYRSLVSHWNDPASVVLGATEPRTVLDQEDLAPELGTVERMTLLDQLSYLPDDILVKVDRAAMAVSLETRVPMLDHRVVEFAWSLPMRQKFRDGQGKWVLRQLLYRHVPRELIERPKQGFSIPLEHWLRGPLRSWAEDLLSAQSLQQTGHLHVESVRQKWAQHLSGQRNWQQQIWNVLMFQSWFFENSPARA